MPDPKLAKKKYWLPFLEDVVKVQPNDVLIGFSSGGACALRYAEQNALAGLVLISPHYTDLGDEEEKVSGYFDEPWNWEAIKNNVSKSVLFHGSGDPWIPIQDFKFISDSIGAERHEILDTKHFLETTSIPGIEEIITQLFSNKP
ncbi:MAG: hypothetical protein KBF89_06380 [Acidimicrobiia bacterium]|nr:hypothetical protein [Acidimicrobiia bacterium]